MVAPNGRRVIVSGAYHIQGCDPGLRKVGGAYYCPPDNPNGGGATPPGYYWDPAAKDESQQLHPDNTPGVPHRTGAFVQIPAVINPADSAFAGGAGGGNGNTPGCGACSGNVTDRQGENVRTSGGDTVGTSGKD